MQNETQEPPYHQSLADKVMRWTNILKICLCPRSSPRKSTQYRWRGTNDKYRRQYIPLCVWFPVQYCRCIQHAPWRGKTIHLHESADTLILSRSLHGRAEYHHNTCIKQCSLWIALHNAYTKQFCLYIAEHHPCIKQISISCTHLQPCFKQNINFIAHLHPCNMQARCEWITHRHPCFQQIKICIARNHPWPKQFRIWTAHHTCKHQKLYKKWR